MAKGEWEAAEAAYRCRLQHPSADSIYLYNRLFRLDFSISPKHKKDSLRRYSLRQNVKNHLQYWDSIGGMSDSSEAGYFLLTLSYAHYADPSASISYLQKAEQKFLAADSPYVDELALVYLNLGKFNARSSKGLAWYQKGWELVQQYPDIKDKSRAWMMVNVGKTLKDLTYYDKAIAWFLSAQDSFQVSSMARHWEIAYKNDIYLTDAYTRIGAFPQAKEYLTHARSRIPPKPSKEVTQHQIKEAQLNQYWMEAIFYSLLGDVSSADLAYEQCEQLARKTKSKYLSNIVFDRYGPYFQQAKYDQAKEKLFHARSLGLSPRVLPKYYRCLVDIFLKKAPESRFALDSARFYLDSLDYHIAHSDDSIAYLAIASHLRGRLSVTSQSYREAISHLRQARAFARKFNRPPNEAAEISLDLARAYRQIGYLQESLNHLNRELGKEREEDRDPIDSLQAISVSRIPEFLWEKALTYSALVQKSTALAERARFSDSCLVSFSHTETSLDYLRDSMKASGSKDFIQKIAFPIYCDYFEAADDDKGLEGRMELLFHISEKTKSLFLYEARQKLGLIQKLDSGVLDQPSDRLPDLSTIQSYLSSETGLLSYFIGHEKYWGILVRHDTSHIFQALDKAHLLATVDSFQQQLRTTPPDKRLGKTLSKLLLAPFYRYFPKKVVVIPPGPLNYLAFEAIPLHEETDSLLIEHHVVSYALSASIWTQNDQLPAISRHQSPDVAVFSPQLTRAHEEVLGSFRAAQQTSLAYHAKAGHLVYRDENAQLGAFWELAPQASIVHILSHGILPQGARGAPSILFQGKSRDRVLLGEEALDGLTEMQLADLFEHPLAIDLVILSVCDMQSGEFLVGEGIANLNRGFTFAGTRSLLTTLWKVDAKNSVYLSSALIDNLKLGYPKDEALALVKRKMIAQGQPAHRWAGHVIFGNMDPLFHPLSHE